MKDGDTGADVVSPRRDESHAVPSTEKRDADMDVDEPPAVTNGSEPVERADEGRNGAEKAIAAESERKDEPAPMQADDDDAVEY